MDEYESRISRVNGKKKTVSIKDGMRQSKSVKEIDSAPAGNVGNNCGEGGDGKLGKGRS